MTLTDQIKQLKKFQIDLIFDINSDWIEPEAKNKMTTQLLLLNASIANLELIHSDEDGQIFHSTIQR